MNAHVAIGALGGIVLGGLAMWIVAAYVIGRLEDELRDCRGMRRWRDGRGR